MENFIPVNPPVEDSVDFSEAIRVRSMKDVYTDIVNARCKCGGTLFPNGPVKLKPPIGAQPSEWYKLMYTNCVGCGQEAKRVYVIDTSSNEFQEERRKGLEDNPRWARLTSGNPIDPESI